MTTATAPWAGLHSPGAHHAVATLNGSLTDDLTGSDVFTLLVVTTLADVSLAPGNERGYYGVGIAEVSAATRSSAVITKRRLDRLVSAGKLVSRPGVAEQPRYWIPDEVNLP